MRRFYKNAEVATREDGFRVTLDGKPVRTPAKQPLVVPSRRLAQGIAEEWMAQGETVDLRSLGLTRLASIALDLVQPRRGAVIAEVAKYAATDLVCYRAETPPELVRRQHEAWQPLVDWATLRFDAPLLVTSGILPAEQPAATLTALAAAVAAYDTHRLAALHFATAACGSLVLALALIEGRLGADAAFAAAELEQSFEIERWGEDPEQTRRRRELQAEIALAEAFVRLLD
ncbi:MAG TPA: ATP12 family protein [Stellaceae bacterium]|nr:ATP12 family protein [Stellaceae bacterium]